MEGGWHLTLVEKSFRHYFCYPLLHTTPAEYSFEHVDVRHCELYFSYFQFITADPPCDLRSVLGRSHQDHDGTMRTYYRELASVFAHDLPIVCRQDGQI